MKAPAPAEDGSSSSDSHVGVRVVFEEPMEVPSAADMVGAVRGTEANSVDTDAVETSEREPVTASGEMSPEESHASPIAHCEINDVEVAEAAISLSNLKAAKMTLIPRDESPNQSPEESALGRFSQRRSVSPHRNSGGKQIRRVRSSSNGGSRQLSPSRHSTRPMMGQIPPNGNFNGSQVTFSGSEGTSGAGGANWDASIERWAQQGKIEGPDLTPSDKLRHVVMEAKALITTACSSPVILISVILTFLSLCGAGITVIKVVEHENMQQKEAELRSHAIELASFFQQELYKAFVPLFTIRTVAVRNSGLSGLSAQMEAFPIRVEEDGTESAKFRDVSQLYDTPTGQSVIEEFNDLAADILVGSEVSDAIMSIQLAPLGVVSILFPLEGNEAAKGHDLFLDPARVPDARKTVNTNDMVMAGPIPLVQGGYFMIGRLPIWIDPAKGHGWDTRQMEGVEKEIEPNKLFWGFSTCIFSYSKLLEESDLTHKLSKWDLVFNLTGTKSRIEDGLTVTETYVLSQTPMEGTKMKDAVSVPVEVPNNQWTLTLAFADGFTHRWSTYAYIGVVLGSLTMASMVLLLLVSRKQHKTLLHRMLPKKAVMALERGGGVVSVFDTVTIFFSDIVGFTEMAGQMEPIEVMEMLNDLYNDFDILAEKHKVYKVETIGDAYMVVGGCPERMAGPEAAAKVTSFALDALECVKHKEHIRIRAGIASGPIVAGVVGRKMPRYSLFGDTVNTAARMESTSVRGRLQLSDVAVALLRESSIAANFTIVQRQSRASQQGIWVKGKGYMTTYWVTSKRPEEDQLALEILDSDDDANASAATTAADTKAIREI